MNKREYNALRKQLDAQLNTDIKAAESRHKDAVAALDTFWSVVSSGGSAPAAPAASARRSAGTKKTTTGKKRGRKPGKKGTLIHAMRGALGGLDGQFTVADVKNNIAKKNAALVKRTQPAVFSTTIKRLEELGELKVVTRGRGRRATIYKKA